MKTVVITLSVLIALVSTMQLITCISVQLILSDFRMWFIAIRIIYKDTDRTMRHAPERSVYQAVSVTIENIRKKIVRKILLSSW